MNTAGLFIIAALITFFTLLTPVKAQIRIAPVTSIGDTVTCHVGGKTFQYRPDHSLISAESWTGKAVEAQAIFDKISDYTNLRTNIYTVPVTNMTVNVEICPGEENYIVYNAEWVRELYRETNNLWVLYAVMAHEAGHYVLGHQHTTLGSNPRIELEADEYAGEVLAKMGASLDNAQAAFKSEKMGPPSHTHPPINQRLDAVKAGWSKVVKRGPSDTVPAALKNKIWLEDGTTIKGERVYLEFELNGRVRTRTASDIVGYVAANVRWSFAGNTLQVEYLDLDTNKVLTEYRGAIKGDRIEGSYKNFETSSSSSWLLTSVDYIPR